MGKKGRRAKRRDKPQRRPNRAAAPNLLSEALKLHQDGQYAQAKEAYCRVLESEPRNAQAWHLLGMLMYQAEQADEAIDCLRKALLIRDDVPEFHSNLGVVCRAAGDLAEAARHLQRAIRLKPDYVDAWNNLGVVWLEQGKLEEAESSFRRVVEHQPNHVLALSNLGNALKEQGQPEQAAMWYSKVLEIDANHFEASNNLGTVLHAQGRLDEAAAMYANAIRVAPEFLQAHVNLGNALKAQGKLDQARENYQRAMQLDPGFAAAHNNLGHLLKVEGRLHEAIASFRQAIAIDSHYALAHNNLGSTYAALGEHEAALDAFREALRLKPDYAEAHSNYLFSLSGDPQIDPEELFAEHVKWGAIHGAQVTPPPSHRNDPDPTRRLRIGYVSPDLRNHAVARYFEPTLANHSSEHVEVICYAEVLVEDEVSARLRSLADGWRSTCGMADSHLADRIRADQIDILVDLAGHTANNRLKVFTHKPAPIQVTWLGYPNTTGLSAIDYRLTNPVQDRSQESGQHVEELIRMPHGASCFAPPQAPAVVALPAGNSGHVTFGSLHRLEKLNHEVYELWCRVLQALPDSRLLVFWPTLQGETKSKLEQQFTRRGIAADRLDFRHQADARGYLGVYDEIDIGLDVFPWAGGTTMREALWMGVVLVALRGKLRTARATAAVLTEIGLAELVADSVEEYVDLAVRLAGDLDRLSRLRSTMRERLQATICDAERFTRDLEEIYRTMWRKWCHEQPQRQALSA